MSKLFRCNKEQAKEVMKDLFPEEKNRFCVEKVLSEVADQSAKINNSNWNVNLTKTFIRFNCGNRYVFNIKPHQIRVMCEREEFLKLSNDFISDFLKSHQLYREDSKELQKITPPRNYEELVAIPKENLWHNSVQFEISIDEWVDKYSEILMASILIFAENAINQCTIMPIMKAAHSPALIDLINDDLQKNLSQPKYLNNAILNEISIDNNHKDTMSAYAPFISLLKTNRNLILHGAPGTGKTYLAKEIAKAMGCTDNEINFVQFHPSYDYTDFVEGLRPKNSDDGNSIGFERKNGVFKEFCERAIKATKNPETIDNFEESWKKLVDKLDEVGVLDISLLSGRGTFPIELNEYGTGLASRTYKTEKRDAWISGKSKFFNKEQLNNIYRGLPGVLAEGYDNYRKAVVKYMKENFGLRDLPSIPNIGAQQLKANVQKQPFIFIIDEINRGEISKIFGELFFSIDPGYRGFDKNGKPKGLVKTQYQNLVEGGEFVNGFYVPENVYIIGTMNDIDRSVESMDFAMRRRFIFKEITSADSATSMKLSEEAMSKMENLNDAISAIEGLNSSYHIGGAYFLKETEIDGVSEKVSVDSSDFADLWELKLEPLLKEYLRGMEDASEKLKSLKDAYDKE